MGLSTLKGAANEVGAQWHFFTTRLYYCAVIIFQFIELLLEDNIFSSRLRFFHRWA